MEQRHHRQQAIIGVEAEPLRYLPCICKQVAVGQQAALRLSGRAGGVNDYRLIVVFNVEGWQFGRKFRRRFLQIVES